MRKGFTSVGVLLLLACPSWAIGPGVFNNPLEEGPDYCVWGRLDYMVWWLKKSPIPFPLVTTGTGASTGALGQPGTTVLYPLDDQELGFFNSLRYSGGFWFDPYAIFGMEWEAFVTEQRTAGFAASSNVAGSPLLAVPFFNAVVGPETSYIVSQPGAFRGNVSVDSAAQFGGGRIDFVLSTTQTACVEINLFSGFRYLGLYERLSLRANRATIPGGGQQGIEDNFRTFTQFFGGELGARLRLRGEIAFFEVTSKFAAGANWQTGEVDGTTTTAAPGVPAAATAGGLFARNTNSGVFSRNDFSIAPEVQARIGLELSSHLKVSAGYDFIFWTNVLRPGNQIDRHTTQPGVAHPTRPQFTFDGTDFFAHGASLGLELRY